MSDEARRQRIEAIDLEVLSLLNRRAALIDESGSSALVGAGLDDEAWLARLEHAQLTGPEPFPASAVRPVFREIINACRATQAPLSVAYLGPPGSFTHMAARSAFGTLASYVESATIASVFDAVAREPATIGVVPIENSTEGGVGSTLDCLLEYELYIRSELVLEVAHCLMGKAPGLSDIQHVYSHPQGLAQCRTWLATHLPQARLVMSPSTSAAARQAADDPNAGAVASRLAAELYGLNVLRTNIQDRVHNSTRFVTLAKSDAPPTGSDKTSLVFSTPHKKGALRAVLEVFDEEELNLTRIESRPHGGRLWEYAFFTDLEGHRTDPAVARALARLESTCGQVRILGSYARSS